MNHVYDTTLIKIVFLIINFASMMIMYIYGKKIAITSNKKLAWNFALVIVIAYSISMGLRFGREIDYNNLFYDYVDIGVDYKSSEYEWFFTLICWILYNIGIPFSGFIWLCSILMVTSFLHLCINHYKEYMPLAGLIFFWEAHDVELLIRYYLAFSLLLFALSYYKSQKYNKAIILAFLACSTHIGMIILLAIMIPFCLLNKPFAPPVVILGLLFMSVFLAKIDIMESFTPYLNILAFNDKSASYVNKYEDIVSGNFSAAGSLEREFSLRYALVLLIKWGLPIFLVPRLLKEKKIGPLECNLFFVGIIIAPIFLQIQILNRISETLTFYSVFVSSASCYYVFRNRKKFNQATYYYACLVAMLTVWPAISMLISRESWWHMLYIWNAGDWDTIPINYYLQDLK